MQCTGPHSGAGAAGAVIGQSLETAQVLSAACEQQRVPHGPGPQTLLKPQSVSSEHGLRLVPS